MVRATGAAAVTDSTPAQLHRAARAAAAGKGSAPETTTPAMALGASVQPFTTSTARVSRTVTARVGLRASRPDGAVTEAADLLARRVRYLSPQLGRGQEELQRSLRHRYGLGEGSPAAQLAVCFGAAAEGRPSLLIEESRQEVQYVWAEPWWEKLKPWAAEEPLLAALLAEGSRPRGAAVPVCVGLDTGGERTYNAE